MNIQVRSNMDYLQYLGVSIASRGQQPTKYRTKSVLDLGYRHRHCATRLTSAARILG